jgi:hypothetical protein
LFSVSEALHNKRDELNKINKMPLTQDKMAQAMAMQVLHCLIFCCPACCSIDAAAVVDVSKRNSVT